MPPIAPCRSTLRAEREARIFSTDVVDPGSLGERPAAGFVRASWMNQTSIFGRRIYPGRRNDALLSALTGVSRGILLFAAARHG